MSERYARIFTLHENLYVENAPIVIRAGALLRDNKTGKFIAQLKFQNISGKTIVYTKISITQRDSENSALDGPIIHEYSNIFITDIEEFGSKNPIALSNTSIVSFSVGISEVKFEDDSLWNCDNTDWKPAENNKKLESAAITGETYKTAAELSKSEIIEDIQKAIELFESISNERNVDGEIESCEKRINEIKELTEGALLKDGTLVGKIIVRGLEETVEGTDTVNLYFDSSPAPFASVAKQKILKHPIRKNCKLKARIGLNISNELVIKKSSVTEIQVKLNQNNKLRLETIKQLPLESLNK